MNKFLSLAMMAGLVSACGLNRTDDDYRSDKVREELAKIQGIAGVYSGNLIDTNGESLGFLSLNLTGSTAITQGAAANEERAVLQMALILRSFKTYQASLPEGSYDVNAKTFRSSLTPTANTSNMGAAGASGSSSLRYTMQVGGKVVGDKLIGSLYVEGFAERGAHFELVRNAAIPAAEDIDLPATSPYRQLEFGRSLEYAGQLAAWPEISPDPMNIQMSIVSSTVQPDQEFVEFFVPRRTVRAEMLVTGRNVTVPFAYDNVVWDSTANTLAYTNNANGKAESLSCSALNNNSSSGWRCVLYVSGNSSRTEFVVRAAN
jgi:hypothetical protein